MNLVISNTNFRGINEIKYGLSKAAEEARNIEYQKLYAYGPRPINKDRDIERAKGALYAYADMFMKDETFSSSILKIVQDKLFVHEIKSILEPIQSAYGNRYPHENFSNAIIDQNKNFKCLDLILNIFKP